jgi:hypothetical protein
MPLRRAIPELATFVFRLSINPGSLNLLETQVSVHAYIGIALPLKSVISGVANSTHFQRKTCYLLDLCLTVHH